GIYVSGPFNTINSNSISDYSIDSTGLNIESDNNNITDNIVSNQKCGISLSESNNILKGNKMRNNTSNFCLDWRTNWDQSKFVNDIDGSNLADGKPIIYWINEHDRRIPENAAFVVLVNCSNITVENLDISKVGQGVILAYSTNSKINQNSIQALDEGILVYSSSRITVDNLLIDDEGTGIELVFSSENTITNNVIVDGGNGIHLTFSSENTIRNNTITKRVRGIQLDESNKNIISWNIISGGSFGGIILSGSKQNVISINKIADCMELALMFWNNASENQFYLNNFVDNAKNVEEYHSGLPDFPINSWDNGTAGNFWSDYYGTDNNNNGIGDTPYIINENNQDNYPLIEMIIIPEFPAWTTILSLFLVLGLTVFIIRDKITKNQEK
ncbi:MAG: NosD domain-containing protein, partial [Candidatus Bathyarchaeota archaeon]